MIYVIVNKNGVPVSKEAYGGDTSNLKEQLSKRAANDKATTFDVYDDSQVSVFDNVSVEAALPSEKMDWQTAKSKGMDTALDFIASKLGLA